MWISIVYIVFVLVFAVVGLVQVIKLLRTRRRDIPFVLPELPDLKGIERVVKRAVEEIDRAEVLVKQAEKRIDAYMSTEVLAVDNTTRVHYDELRKYLRYRQALESGELQVRADIQVEFHGRDYARGVLEVLMPRKIVSSYLESVLRLIDEIMRPVESEEVVSKKRYRWTA